MTWQDAHFRMLATLPVHTHHRKTVEREVTNDSKRLVYQGVIYDSISDACRKLGKCNKTITKLVDEGKARIVD